MDHNLTRQTRGWKQRNPGITRRKVLEVLSSAPMTAKSISQKIGITSIVMRKDHLKGKTGLTSLGLIRIQEGKDSYGAEIFEITEQGRKYLQLPEIGLLSTRVGRSKVKLLRILAEMG